MKLEKGLSIMHTKQYLKKSGIIASFLLIWTFPLMSFSLRPLTIIVFMVCCVLFLFSKKDSKPHNELLVNSFLYLTYLISLTYTENIKDATDILIRALPILVFPLAFIIISRKESAVKSLINKRSLFYKIFIYSSAVVALLILIRSLQFFELSQGKIKVNPLIDSLQNNFHWISDHPIYLSMTLAISLIMSAWVLTTTKKWESIVIIILILLKTVAIIIMARKGVLVSLLLTVFLIIFLSKKTVFKKTLLFASILISIIITSVFTKDTTKRFKEVFDKKSYVEVKEFSSTSIRYFIYSCSIDKIIDYPILGYGVGDTNHVLSKCYKEKSNHLYHGKYNSHNQYLGIILTSGVIGLMMFLYSLFWNFSLYRKSHDYNSIAILIFFILMMFFENILDRQNGIILYSFFVNYMSALNFNSRILKAKSN